MQIIHGPICIAYASARPHNIKLLFGKSTNNKNRSYQNFETNSLTPFQDEIQAQKAYKELSNIQDILRVEHATIDLHIAETQLELNHFKEREAYIIIAREQNLSTLFGKITDPGENDYPLRAEQLRQNNLTPFDYLDKAKRASEEIIRQMRVPVYIAEFKLI